MARIAVLGALCLLSSPAMAEQSFGDWEVLQDRNAKIAYTVTAHGEFFGVMCESRCTFYLDLDRECEEGERYSALVNDGSGAFPTQLECSKGEKNDLLFFDDGVFDDDSFSPGGKMSIALPIGKGEISVFRFSLEGSSKAADAVGISKAEDRSSRPAQPVGLTI